MSSTIAQPRDARISGPDYERLAERYLKQPAVLRRIVSMWASQHHPEGTLFAGERVAGSGYNEFTIRYRALEPSAEKLRRYALQTRMESQVKRDAEAEAKRLDKDLRERALREFAQGGEHLSFADIPHQCKTLIRQRMAALDAEIEERCSLPPRWIWDQDGWRDEVSGAVIGAPAGRELLVLLYVGRPLPDDVSARARCGAVFVTDRAVTEGDINRLCGGNCMIFRLGAAFEQFCREHTDPSQRIAPDVPEI